MGYREMFVVRASGMTDRTQVDVLEALAFFLNGETGACFPSTDSIARVARLSPNIVRRSIKELEESGFIRTSQKPGGKRNFSLLLDRLPNGCVEGEGEGQSHPEKTSEPTGVSEVKGVSHLKGVSEVKVPPFQKCDPSPFRSESTPLSDLTPEQGIEQGTEQGSNAHASRSLPRATHTREDDEKSSAQPATPEEPPFDAGLFDEAQQVASESLESFENEACVEVACSGVDQTPAESIEILHATRSNPIFSTNTPNTNQNAVARKSDVVSKPKRRTSAPVERPADVSAQAWDDWMTVRKAKRLPVTPTALAGIRREAEKAGVSLTDAITFAVEQGWAGFRADWYSRATAKSSSPASSSGGRYLTAQERYEERMRKAGEMSDEEYFAQFDLPEEILNYEKAQEAKRHVAS